MSEPILCLNEGDAWYYFLPADWVRVTWQADAPERTEVLARAPHQNPNQSRWYVGTFLAERIVKVTPQPPLPVRWDLIDESAESGRFPRTLTNEEYAERRRGLDDDADWPERALYQAVTEAQLDKFEYFEGPWLHADGEPAPADGRSWTARLPYELSHHRELLHLFPGQLDGFHEALKKRLEEIPGVEVYTSSGFQVYAKVPYDPPRQSWQGDLLRTGSRSKKRGHQVQERLTRSQVFSPPRGIAGPNRAQAAVAWDTAMAKFVAVVTEMATVRPCGACGGTGITPHEKRVVR